MGIRSTPEVSFHPPPSSTPLPVPRHELDDATLLSRCAQGDELAWEQLLARYQGLVYSTALGVGLDRDDAADVFQYVWVELHRSIPRFRHAVALPRWLMVATRRNAYKVAAQRRRVVHETFEDMTDPAALADAQVEAAESRRHIETALAALDERCREFVRLFFLEPVKTSYERIAAEANLAIGSIGPTRARCLQKLRRALGARR